jgi:uncharacterized protein
MDANSLASTLFPKSRRVVLGLLLSHPDQAFYLREIAEKTGLGIGHLQRELDRLVKSNIIRTFRRGRHVFYQAEPACPIFDELRGIVIKTMGVAGKLRQTLLPLRERIRIAFVFGSVARRQDNSASDVDLMIVGDASLAEVVDVIRGIEKEFGRPVNPTVYPCEEFAAKLAAGHHFVTRVVQGEKLMVIGDEDEFKAISGQ